MPPSVLAGGPVGKGKVPCVQMITDCPILSEKAVMFLSHGTAHHLGACHGICSDDALPRHRAKTSPYKVELPT
eukprot:416636-Amphidinium_carterae.1